MPDSVDPPRDPAAAASEEPPPPAPSVVDHVPPAPEMEAMFGVPKFPAERSAVDRRTVQIAGIAVLLGLAASLLAAVLVKLIAGITNLAFFGRLSVENVSPEGNTLGIFVIVVPVLGGIAIGLLARYGSKAIRGHGIPEAMEQVLTNESRIPARVLVLKPFSAAVSIGTGGPFGSEGPVIATGGALGSLVGQLFPTTPHERKTLLAAGAAAGMSASFGSPVGAVLLAVELLLFEYRARSIIPVALAAAAAAGMRAYFEGREPMFAMPPIAPAPETALGFYMLLGAFMGVVAAGITRLLNTLEEGFERLPIHWMWHPAIGGAAVGVVGWFAPQTLGVGYHGITSLLSDKMTVGAALFLSSMKFVSWSISIASGTSGGTLAPLFTVGGGIGLVVGTGVAAIAPFLGVDVRVAALVGMATIFAGASRAMLATAVLVFETTQQSAALLPLLAGCAASHLAASLLGKHSIMTEKMARQGVQTPTDYLPDPLEQVRVGVVATADVVTLPAEGTVAEVRRWLAVEQADSTHQGYPVVDAAGNLRGVLTRRDLLRPGLPEDRRLVELIHVPPRVVYDDSTARQAADHMLAHDIGRLPVLSRAKPHRLVGFVTRSDVLAGYRDRLHESDVEPATYHLPHPGGHSQPPHPHHGDPSK